MSKIEELDLEKLLREHLSQICHDFTKMPSHVREMGRVYYKHLYYVFKFLCNIDYDSDKIIHVLCIPTTRSCDYTNLLVL